VVADASQRTRTAAAAVYCYVLLLLLQIFEFCRNQLLSGTVRITTHALSPSLSLFFVCIYNSADMKKEDCFLITSLCTLVVLSSCYVLVGQSLGNIAATVIRDITSLTVPETVTSNHFPRFFVVE
jgi:hypothetical protein